MGAREHGSTGAQERRSRPGSASCCDSCPQRRCCWQTSGVRTQRCSLLQRREIRRSTERCKAGLCLRVVAGLIGSWLTKEPKPLQLRVPDRRKWGCWTFVPDGREADIASHLVTAPEHHFAQGSVGVSTVQPTCARRARRTVGLSRVALVGAGCSRQQRGNAQQEPQGMHGHQDDPAGGASYVRAVEQDAGCTTTNGANILFFLRGTT